MVDYQHTFSPSLLTNARFAFSRINISELQLDSNLDTATTVGIPNINLGTVYTTSVPQFSISDPVTPFAMGDFGLPFFETESDFQFYNNWSKTVGRHSFKFGGDVEKFFGRRTDVSGRGAFNFAQSLTGLNQTCNAGPCPTTGSGLAAFELGLSSNFGRDITLVQPQEKQWRWAFYGQDNWRVTPRLTLLLGLRWDYSTPIFSQNGKNIGNLDLNTGNVLLTNLAGKYAGVTTSKTEFSPRVGMSYRLMKDTVIRGGFGRSYFNNPDGAGFGTQGCCYPIKESQSDAGPNPFASVPYTLDQGPGLPAPLPPYPANGQLPLGNLSDIFPGVGPYPHSYNDSYNVTVEHAFPYEITMSVAYVGNHGRHLWDNVDVNAPVPGPNVGGSFDPNRPYFAKFGWTNSETQRNNQLAGYPEMKSNYNSLQARVEKRFHAGLYIMSNFTWDKSLDLGTFGPQNIFNFASNYGNSDATRPWAWISAFNWELPFGRGRMFANSMSRAADAAIGGWAFSGIVNLEAGQYFTPTLADASSLNSTIGLRPDRIGSGTVPHPNRFEWFNPNDFTAVPTPFTYGNSGRNILEEPGFGFLSTCR